MLDTKPVSAALFDHHVGLTYLRVLSISICRAFRLALPNTTQAVYRHIQVIALSDQRLMRPPKIQCS